MLTKKQIQQLEKDGYDLKLLQKVQPHGNLNMSRSNYYTTGDGAYTVLHVYGYPTEGLGNQWMKDLLQQPNVRSFWSNFTAKPQEIKKLIKKSIEEEKTQMSDKNKTTDNQDLADSIQHLLQLYRDISQKNVGWKKFYIRLFVFASSVTKLENQVEEIKEKCSQFKMCILQDELPLEYLSVWLPPEEQGELENAREPKAAPVRELAGGFFFEHTKLEDKPRGSYFGYTRTDGAINFDFFKRTEKRTRSLMLISGNPRMGQTTFSMNLMDDCFMKNHVLRILSTDTTGKWNNLVEKQCGIRLDLAGEENRINLFQVFPTATLQDGVTTDEITSFGIHIEKLKTQFFMFNPALTADDLTVLGQKFIEFYIFSNLWYLNPQAHLEELRATKVIPSEYPTLTDFLQWIEGEKRNNKEISLAHSLNRIFLTASSLKSQYGELFDGTTEFQSIAHEKVVIYDAAKLLGTPNVLYIQIFSILTLLSADILNHAKQMRNYLAQYPQISEEDLPKYVVNFTDANHILTPQFPQGVELMANMIEKMSENFAGVVLSVNSLQGILFERGAVQGHNPYVESVKKLFSLMQYRVFAQTSETDIPLLANALAGSLTESEIEILPKLEEKQLFMNIAGLQNYVFTQQICDLESGSVEMPPQRYGGWN